MKYLTLSVTVAALLSTQSAFAVAIKSDDAWIRLPRGNNKMTGAFVSLTNTQKLDDQLISASCDCAEVAEIHETTNHNGMMKMHQVAALDIKAGETVALKPGSLHIMLIGIRKPLKDGDTVKLQLNFKQAGAVTVEAKVKGN